MTYCCAISVSAGIIFCSDSRTNAGVDQVSTYSKMFTFELGDDRQFVVLGAGNLATTQATLAQMKKDIRQNTELNLATVATIGEAADYIGEVSRAQQEKHGTTSPNFEASFISGGADRRLSSSRGNDLSGRKPHHKLQGYTLPADWRKQIR